MSRKNVIALRTSVKVEQEPNIVKAHSDVIAANDVLANAEAARAAAHKRVADALNSLNKAQRVFDDTVTMIRGGAPAHTVWFGKKR